MTCPSSDKELQTPPASTEASDYNVSDRRARFVSLLSQPEVRLIMAADRVDEEALLSSLSSIAAALSSREPEFDENFAPHSSLNEYRPGVGIILLNSENNVFVGQRLDVEGAWQLPQGGIEPHESPCEAVLRELSEELGTNKVEFLAETSGWHTYDLPIELQGHAWNGRWKGQRQKWFVLRFVGQNSDINVATEHPEFRAWRWVSAAALPSLAVSFKHQIYLRLVKEFEDLLL